MPTIRMVQSGRSQSSRYSERMITSRFKALSGVALAALLLAALLLAGCAAPAASTTEETSAPAVLAPSAPATPAVKMTDTERVAAAEAAALAELPDAPIWKGMSFEGAIVNESEVCVDRTYEPGGGLDGLGGSAGYVVVRFPMVTPGKPQDGLCASYVPTDEKVQATVEVPSEVSKDPGLMISTRFGDEWPLTVPYVVGHCDEITVSGRSLQMATVDDPNGKTYAANGTAKDHGNFLDIDPIWASNPDVSGLKKDISPVIDAALALCD